MPKRTSSTSGSPERDKAKVECSTLLTRGLRALQAEYPQVGDVPGPGLFIGVELVKDPATREPAPAEARRIVDEAWKRGVILATASALPNVIKLKPPLIIEEVETVLGVVAECLEVVFPGR